MSTRGDADQRAGRRRRRVRLLALPAGVALLAVGLKLTTMFWYSSQGAAAYADEAYRRSEAEFDRLRVLNVIEPWRVPFGVGGARYRLGDLLGAEAAFAAALELAPRNCEIRFNLAVTIEAEGDELLAGKPLRVEDIENINPLARYAVARDLINEGTCPSLEPDDAGDRLAQALERITAKLGGEEVPPPRPPGDDGDPGDDPDQAPTEDQVHQLSERTQLAATSRDDVSDFDPDAPRPDPQLEW